MKNLNRDSDKNEQYMKTTISGAVEDISKVNSKQSSQQKSTQPKRKKNIKENILVSKIPKGTRYSADVKEGPLITEVESSEPVKKKQKKSNSTPKVNKNITQTNPINPMTNTSSTEVHASQIVKNELRCCDVGFLEKK